MDILKKNFFELFNIEIAIDVNKSELDEKVKVLQNKFHPDKFSSGSDFEKRLALQISSHINDINFLQEQIEYSELVESLNDNFDSKIIETSLSSIKSLLKTTVDSIKSSFESNDFENVWQNLSKLRFYIKNINELVKLRNK